MRGIWVGSILSRSLGCDDIGGGRFGWGRGCVHCDGGGGGGGIG